MRNYNYTFTGVELSNELKHSGRKGMKWYQHIFGREQVGGYAKGAKTKGVGGKSGSSEATKKKDRKPRQVQEYDNLKKKKTSEMTDAEINRMMARMDLEKRLNAKRYEESKSSFDKFMDKYGDMLVREGTNFLKDQGSKVVDKMLDKALKESGTAQEAKKITREMADQAKNEADYYQNLNRRDNAKRQYDNNTKAETKDTSKQTKAPEPETKPSMKERAEKTQSNKVAAARKEAERSREKNSNETPLDSYGYRRRRRYKK